MVRKQLLLLLQNVLLFPRLDGDMILLLSTAIREDGIFAPEAAIRAMSSSSSIIWAMPLDRRLMVRKRQLLLLQNVLLFPRRRYDSTIVDGDTRRWYIRSRSSNTSNVFQQFYYMSNVFGQRYKSDSYTKAWSIWSQNLISSSKSGVNPEWIRSVKMCV
jgi:hypothetical protein